MSPERSDITLAVNTDVPLPEASGSYCGPAAPQQVSQEALQSFKPGLEERAQSWILSLC